MGYRAHPRSGYGLHVKKRTATVPKLKQSVGYRVGDVYEVTAKTVLAFEVEELGNDHLLRDVAKALDCKPDLESITNAIERRWGPMAKAIWLCNSKKWAEYRYGPSGSSKVVLPANAAVICDLGEDGKLYVYSGQEDWC